MENLSVRAGGKFLVPGLLCLSMFILYYLGMREGYGHDEVEHLHVAYLMTQGLLPYADFPQNHLPLFWWLLIPIVRIFPNSIQSFLVVRVIYVLLLPVVFLCARKFIPCKNDKEKVMRDVGLIFSLFLYAIYCQWLLIRPDVILAVLTALILGLLGAQKITVPRLILTGLLLGLATLLSIKVYSVYLLVAIVILFQARERGVLTGLKFAAAFSLGVLSVLVPLIFWLFSHELLPQFLKFVWELNRVVPMTASHRIHLLASPLLFTAVAGAVSLYGDMRGEEHGRRKAFIILFMIVSSCFALQAGNHGDSYNYLYSVMPLAVGTSFLMVKFYQVLKTKILKLAFTIAVPCMLFFNEFPASFFIKLRSTYTRRAYLEALIDFTKQNEDTTCTAFSPLHPVFCEDVSPAMLGWDYIFYEKVESGYFREFYTELFKKSFFQTLKKKPDIIVVSDLHNPWTFIKVKGILHGKTIGRIWKFRNKYYDEITIANMTIWLRKGRFDELLEDWVDIPEIEEPIL